MIVKLKYEGLPSSPPISVETLDLDRIMIDKIRRKLKSQGCHIDAGLTNIYIFVNLDKLPLEQVRSGRRFRLGYREKIANDIEDHLMNEFIDKLN